MKEISLVKATLFMGCFLSAGMLAVMRLAQIRDKKERGK